MNSSNKSPQLKDRKDFWHWLFILTLFSFLFAQYYKIQIIEGERWTKIANKQHYFIVNEPFMRGRFISNTSIKEGILKSSRLFVVDILKYHLHADPDSIPQINQDEILNHLAQLLDLTEENRTFFENRLNIRAAIEN